MDNQKVCTFLCLICNRGHPSPIFGRNLNGRDKGQGPPYTQRGEGRGPSGTCLNCEGDESVRVEGRSVERGSRCFDGRNGVEGKPIKWIRYTNPSGTSFQKDHEYGVSLQVWSQYALGVRT